MSSSSSPSSSSSTTDPPAGGPNALVNLSIYASISLVYLYLNFKLPDNLVLKIVYLILMLGINFGLIFWMMSSQCKATPNLGVTIGGSVLTWIMFVVMFFALETMYVWLRPFGNTFGYLCIKLLGVVGFMDGILKTPAQADDDASRRMNKYINYVRSDPWGFFSMLTTNADAEPKILQAGEAFDELRGKLTQQAVDNLAENKQQFINFVRIKESVGKFVFYLLTLNLMTDMTAVFVMENDNNCIVNANIVKGANDVHNQKHGGRLQPKANANAVVYKTTE
jgi:hypothetical protein